MGRLEGKVAILTGAGSGIGQVAAQLFAAEGAAVVVADVVAEAAGRSAAVDRGRRAGGAGAVDVRTRAGRRRWCSWPRDTFGALDMLFNNAGIFPTRTAGVLDTPPATWDRVIEVNLKGVWFGCRAAVPAMLASGGGSIVNVASFVALMGAATAQVAYTAIKGGVLALTREMAVEYAREGIRANAICPGPIETPLLAELLADPERRAAATGPHPHGPLGRPEEIAAAALFLACDESSFMTGSALVVDGGITAAYVTPDRTAEARGRRGAGAGLAAAAGPGSGVLTLETPAPPDAHDGDIDTVVVAFPDLQGRPVGKRVTGHFFLDRSLPAASRRATTCWPSTSKWTRCPGTGCANWEKGYGDVHCRIDPKSLRPLPWLDRHRPGALRPASTADRRAGRGVAPAHAPPPDRAGRRARLDGATAPPSSSSTCSATRSRRPRPRVGRDCSPTPPPSRTTSCCRRPARSTSSAGSATRWSAPGSRSSSRRGRPGRASTRSTSPTARPSRWPTGTSSSRTGSRRSPGSSAGPPPSWPSGRWPRPARRAMSTPASGTRQRSSRSMAPEAGRWPTPLLPGRRAVRGRPAARAGELTWCSPRT